ncbi:hypothetical protein CcaCcLH18_07829 [Colletotrichum camelliae]|nr:hypothetical protein CcaCcLH18_07829 [Colletotrichum camelliae]
MCRKVFLNLTLCGHDRPRYTPCENATYVFESGYRLCSVLTTRDDYIDDAFCDQECCYRICNRLWRCCICDIPNRNRHDCYRCSHTICPECYPEEDPRKRASRLAKRRAGEQEEGTNHLEVVPKEIKQDEPHERPEGEGPRGYQDPEGSKVGNTENHVDDEAYVDAKNGGDVEKHGEVEDQSEYKIHGGGEHRQQENKHSRPSTQVVRRTRPRIPIYDPSVDEWV